MVIGICLFECSRTSLFSIKTKFKCWRDKLIISTYTTRFLHQNLLLCCVASSQRSHGFIAAALLVLGLLLCWVLGLRLVWLPTAYCSDFLTHMLGSWRSLAITAMRLRGCGCWLCGRQLVSCVVVHLFHLFNLWLGIR